MTMRSILTIAFSWLFIAVYACDCNSSNIDHYKLADVVFVGKVVRINADSFDFGPEGYKLPHDKNFFSVTLEVQEVSKGTMAFHKTKNVTIRIHSLEMSSCGIDFHNYKIFEVYAYYSKDRNLWTDYCSGVKLLSNKEEQTKIERHGKYVF